MLSSTLITALLIASTTANSILTCTTTPNPTCANPIDEITHISPTFVVAKLPCLDCPTVNRKGPDTHHEITHEENALFLNLTLTPRALLLNSIPIYPPLSLPPPRIYIGQIPPPFTNKDLATSIACKTSCADEHNCWCIEPSLGAYGVSYSYTALSTSDNKWTIVFDIIGGLNGYQDDPYIEFTKPGQKVLVLEITDTSGTIELLDIKLVERVTKLPPSKTSSVWLKIVRFFGFKDEAVRGPGHLVVDVREWEDGVRVGTLWYFVGRAMDYWLPVVIVISVFLGLVGLWVLSLGVRRVYRWEGGGRGVVRKKGREEGVEGEGLLGWVEGRDGWEL
ncbi:hypothetical protein GLAREA_10593 [Glarea lozoyensis ATCC 20868]|uniref:Uncharacterized protein n=1 Tax=Glarea lozoyensis (strain ATCC 20868 / MF5171) TaxID=1116229 RepID=S3E9D3_GLAL2|nr:uncharacterized protein GLAREA_10593 [Glarea lozoyensis ATCC 20868]EPE34898.1 hypothetical protein GLAREA_10593 [Glarea lozoyensis ATCC 20868]